MDDEFGFAEWLEEMMAEKGLTIKQVAYLVGHSYASIRYYLMGERSPNIVIANDFMNLFGKKLVVVDK